MKYTPMKRNRTRKTLSILLILLFASALLPAADLDFYGQLRTRTGIAFDVENPDLLMQDQLADFTLEGWGADTRLMLNSYMTLGLDGTPELGLREAYVDIYLPEGDFRVGKQAIVWGAAEGAFITDIVSPQDLSSFITADFREIRMGIFAVKGDYYAGPFTFEGVWIPGFVPSIKPSDDSIWAVTPDQSWIPAGMTPKSNAAKTVDQGFESSEVFAKVSYFGSAFNAELMGGYAWDDLPVLSIDRSAAPTINVTPVYERMVVTGGSISTTIGAVVLRSEAAVYFDRAFTSTALIATDGIEEHNQVQALAGIDSTLFGARVSAQYILQYIDGYSDAMVFNEEFQHTVTFMAQKSFASDTLTAKVFGYVGFDPVDLLLRPSLAWDIEDGVELTAGADLFLGDSNGQFGQYGDNSMGYLSLKWFF